MGHFSRFRRTGDYQADKPLKKKTKVGELRRWIEQLVSMDEWPADLCITWPFATDENGYGVMRSEFGRKAHRLVCALVYGPPTPENPDVRHLCGKGGGGCVNPNHLKWGTMSENIEDSARHGTLNTVKLTPAKVRYIRAHPEIGDVAFAKLFGLNTRHAIDRARSGVTWHHIDPDGPVWEPPQAA